jgi:hypothetical protein
MPSTNSPFPFFSFLPPLPFKKNILYLIFFFFCSRTGTCYAFPSSQPHSGLRNSSTLNMNRRWGIPGFSSRGTAREGVHHQRVVYSSLWKMITLLKSCLKIVLLLYNHWKISHGPKRQWRREAIHIGPHGGHRRAARQRRRTQTQEKRVGKRYRNASPMAAVCDDGNSSHDLFPFSVIGLFRLYGPLLSISAVFHSTSYSLPTVDSYIFILLRWCRNYSDCRITFFH